MPSKSRRRRELERDECFGADAPKDIWKPRDNEGAFLQHPRILTQLSLGPTDGPKMKATHRVLLWELWSAAWDERSLLVDLDECAFVLGFKGQRARRTVQDHLKDLEDAGLIRVHEKFGVTRVLLRDPYRVLKEWRDRGAIDEHLLFLVKGRIADFGGRDIDQPRPVAKGANVRPIRSAKTSESNANS